MGYKTPGVETESLPEHLVKIFTDAFEVKIFIETGTAGGSSITTASKMFNKCYTIELIEGRVDSDMKKSVFYNNVEFLTGNSVDILGSLITNHIGHYIFFFLDAHYSDSVPNTSGVKECPVLEELKIISSHQTSIILIDDARLFLGQPPYPNDPRDWPTIEEIFSAAKVLFPNHHTTITDDFVLIYPDAMIHAVTSEWRKRFTVRYPSADDKIKSDAKNVFNALKSYLDV